MESYEAHQPLTMIRIAGICNKVKLANFDPCFTQLTPSQSARQTAQTTELLGGGLGEHFAAFCFGRTQLSQKMVLFF